MLQVNLMQLTSRANRQRNRHFANSLPASSPRDGTLLLLAMRAWVCNVCWFQCLQARVVTSTYKYKEIMARRNFALNFSWINVINKWKPRRVAKQLCTGGSYLLNYIIIFKNISFVSFFLHPFAIFFCWKKKTNLYLFLLHLVEILISHTSICMAVSIYI